jgi:DNA-binding HxlR family transcriptional regulator
MNYSIGNKNYSCPLLLTLETISGKWKGVIIWFLLENGTLRFSTIKTKMNQAKKITDKMLIQCLRELETDGIITRKIHQVAPPKVEYSLTEVGKNLKPVFVELIRFGLSQKENPSSAPEV